MIKYNLKCKNKHEFESWFSDSKEFEKLLNTQLSKIQIEEGKIIEGKINKITEKFVFLFVEGLKSEPVLDINELKSMGHKNISYINDLSNLNTILAVSYTHLTLPTKRIV